MVSPRTFPLLTEDRTLPCDQMLSIDSIRKDFPYFQIHNTNDDLWKKGIKCMPHKEFNSIANNFLLWCKAMRRKKIFIVSHDGTITAYREILTKQKLTREDFLGETGWIRINVID
ncbi:hypothetical protein COL81_25410 [Bacillus toyonensis]|nr:hypothetical protein COL81_25410 [Bacillus toyonensis]